MTGVGRFTWRTGAVVFTVAVAVLIGMIVLADVSEKEKPRVDHPAPVTRYDLTFAVWGNKDEVAAYESVVDDYNASSKDTHVTIVSWPTPDAMLAAIRAGSPAPDLYLLPRSDLAEVMAEKRNQPLLDLLTEREIPIGDDFARDAVAAFSVDNDLQCMPYTVSPMVMYYNTDLVDFAAMKADGLPTPKDDNSGWNFAEFRAAAEFASRPRRKTRGVYIEPTLRGLAPFVYSGGGQVFDDDNAPTSLALGDDSSTSALRQTLELLRDPRLTLSARQLAQRSALDWFKRGKVAMIAGYRSLTPELRNTPGLHFDVMPMPSLGSTKTVAEINGICLGHSRPARAEASANFLTYLVSDEVVARVAETGYIQPAKLTIALSKDFLQPDLAPAHSMVFNNAMRSIELPPLIPSITELRQLVNPDIEALFTTPSLDDLSAALLASDEKSRTLLDPSYTPSESPSEGPSDSASGEPSDSATR
jgi:multiple sugar transport system substrate-binding protein